MIESSPPKPPILVEPVHEGDGSLTLSFDPSTNSGGPPIIGYVVRVQPGDREVEASSSPFTITGLTNGKSYRVSVAAVNHNGRSDWSQESKEATPGKDFLCLSF